MEVVTFIIGALVGAGAMYTYQVNISVSMKNRKQTAKGGNNSTVNQAGRDVNDSGSHSDG